MSARDLPAASLRNPAARPLNKKSRRRPACRAIRNPHTLTSRCPEPDPDPDLHRARFTHELPLSALRHLQFALDSAPVGILCIDHNGSFTYVNSAACSVFGWTPDDFSTRCMFDLFPDYTPQAWNHYWGLLRDVGQARYLYPFVRQDRTRGVLECHCAFFTLHGREGVYAFVRDVTDREQARIERESRDRALQSSRERLRRLNARVIHAQDQERRRLARELHDDLGQSLALLKVQLSSIAKKIGAGDPSAPVACRETMQALEQIIESVRRLSRDLSPCMIEDVGLTESLRMLCRDFIRHTKLKARLSIADIDDLLGPDEQINLYRFFQETLTNIQKHARARNLSVLLCRRNRRITVRISDNGIGFMPQPPGQEHRQRGLGLTTLEERACMLNGIFAIQSAPGRGTCVSLRFPAGGGR